MRFIVHERPLGLIGAKRTGADAARGGIIVFFDCHVKPAPDYWVPFVENVEKNYRRVVVPIITTLVPPRPGPRGGAPARPAK